MLVSREGDDKDERADEGTPSLVGEDVGKHGSTSPDVGPVTGDRSRHRVVTADTNTKNDTEDGEPDEGAGSGEIACVAASVT